MTYTQIGSIFLFLFILNTGYGTPLIENQTTTEVQGRNANPQFVTYDNFGTFSLRPGYKKLPESPSKVNTTFFLYRKIATVTPGEIISVNNLGSFDPTKPIKVIIHGFTDTAKNYWVIKMKDELLKPGDMNVIAVDWSGGNQFPYDQAVANTVIAGTALHKLLEKMIQRGAKGTQMHLIGHSLGAHIAGHTGKLLGNLARISALDPAGPDFYINDIDFRLDATDATFVDVIHTDGAASVHEGFGHLNPLGHVDFYPNGGSIQPTCGRDAIDVVFQTLTSFATSFNVNNALDTLACNHMSAIHYYIDSINTKSSINSYPCSSFSNFENGLCTSCGRNSQCQQMGYHASPTRQLGTLYLLTQHGVRSPFFGTHLKVTIKSDDNNDQQTKGTVTINFTNGLSYTVINPDTKLTPGFQTTKVILVPSIPISFQDFQITFQKNFGLTFGFGLADQWSFKSINIFDLESNRSYQFCPESNTKIKSGSRLKYQLCN